MLTTVLLNNFTVTDGWKLMPVAEAIHEILTVIALFFFMINDVIIPYLTTYEVIVK